MTEMPTPILLVIRSELIGERETQRAFRDEPATRLISIT